MFVTQAGNRRIIADKDARVIEIQDPRSWAVLSRLEIPEDAEIEKAVTRALAEITGRAETPKPPAPNADETAPKTARRKTKKQ